jgi:hypothetical protein
MAKASIIQFFPALLFLLPDGCDNIAIHFLLVASSCRPGESALAVILPVRVNGD